MLLTSTALAAASFAPPSLARAAEPETVTPAKAAELDRTVLPITPPAFAGKIGETYKDSSSRLDPVLPVQAPKGAPNVLVIVLDDVGYGQLRAYGGPIDTPNLDKLASEGVRYTDFHTTALCSPTRAALLTGRNHHSVGLAAITEGATGFPSSFGSIPKSAATIAEVLKQNGYEANKDVLGAIVNGWVVTKGLGTYGTDYMKRAVVAAYGWPANQQDDAVYPYTEVDSRGQKLTGANEYTLTFAKDATPPVNGFWSITMYEIDQGWWFVPNALNKFTVSPRNNLKSNADGSVTLYFQNASPGAEKEANWPAPKGEFIPMLRMYWPKENNPSILNGGWKPPAVVKAN